MGKSFLLTTLLALLLLAASTPLENGRKELARRQFDLAQSYYQRQDFFQAMRAAHLASGNSPRSAAPWLLLGHCYYFQGQDAAALWHYGQAQRLNPRVNNLPPFYDSLRTRVANPAARLAADETAQLKRKIGQMLLIIVPGTRLSAWKREMLANGWAGGVILFGQNIKTQEQVREYVREIQQASAVPLIVAVDQEGGAVRRFREEQGFSRLPSLAAVGENGDPDIAYRFGRLAGHQLRSVGANLNFSPVVDLEKERKDAIISPYRRSLGSDPQRVSLLAERIMAGMKSQKIIATAKHFPAQTLSVTDTHDGSAMSDATVAQLMKTDLAPYQYLIPRGLDAVMVSHITCKAIDPYFPASMSHEVVQNLLRKKLGFAGLVISDDLRMGAIKRKYPLDVSVVQAVNAGVDMLMVTDNTERRVMNALVRAVARGQVKRETIDAAYTRIIALKQKYGILRRLPSGVPTPVPNLPAVPGMAPGSSAQRGGVETSALPGTPDS
jgi:beta-N-acetylhexosaminidase